MAGMFYSVQEVAEKLNKTEDQISKLVQSGRLREFRDGSNLLFKVDEVEALMSDTNIMALEESSAAAVLGTPDAELPQDAEALLADTNVTAMEESAAAIEQPQNLEQLAEPQPPAEQAPLSEDDTVMAQEGLNILEETDSDSGVPEDMLGETTVAPEQTSLADDSMGETKATSADEVSLEEIEEDVNLDSFGSGSGLLDLSLQADDTSLGGILDEIYAPQGEEGDKAAMEPAMDVEAETEQMLAETIQPTLTAPAALAREYVEPEPDTLSNAFGFMLFLPLLAIIYTAIVAVAGFNNVVPMLLETIQGIIWYIMLGLAVAAGLIVAVPFMLSSSGAKAVKKPRVKKKKVAKKPKVKKAKKTKS